MALVKVLAVGQVLFLGLDVPFLSANHYGNQNIEPNKKHALTICKKSL